MAIRLTMCFPDYARLVPLAIGDVKPEGVDLTWIRGVRAEMLARVLGDKAIDGGEHSLAQHLYRIARGDRSFVAIPVFPLRNFGARDIYVRKDSGLTRAGDLPGKRVGMYGWSASGSIWYRHLLRHLDVDVDRIRWTIGPVDAPMPGASPALPPGVLAAPPGRMLVDMLMAGDLDAVVSPVRPRGFDVERGPLVRLMANFREVEQAYFRRTRCFPPQHVVIMRRERVAAAPELLGRLQAAFDEAERRFVEGIRLFPYASPWLDADLDDTDTIMGVHYHAHGLAANRSTLEAFAEQAHRSGLVPRLVGVDEMFEEFIAATKA